jgi:peptidoglycan/xylan/chitin deacetylase (PgdA/CDA1 family)
MPATFIFSFDCEGKWGVADALTPATHRALTDERLKQAYRGLVDLLARFEIPATFAFVGLFAEPAPQMARLRDRLDTMARLSPDYLAPALSDLHHGSRQGWHGAWAVDLVASGRNAHEIAFHGVTHIPWDQMNKDVIAQEIGLHGALTSVVRRSRTMVFPRNRVARLDTLRSLDIQGYRMGLNRPRAINLLDEANPLPRLQFGARADPGLIAIPAGYFVNWQHGLRRLIPRAWSRRRAKWLIERAARAGSIVHFWLHPENIAQAPRTLARLEDILGLVRDAREAGRGEVITQTGYCLDSTQDNAEPCPGGERIAPRNSRQV